MTLNRLLIIWICVSALLGGTADGQWISYPSPATPRLRNGRPNLAAPTPRTTDGKPDLSGIWSRIRYIGAGRGDGLSDLANYLPAGTSIPFLPWAADLTRQRLAMSGAGLPSERCLPKTFPNQMMIADPIQIVQGPAFTLVLFEELNHFRQIMTDGRTHPADRNPTWFGYSVGRWDGDTMVVDTLGFRDQMWLDGTGHPSTERLRVTERYQRRNFGHLDVELTFDDSGAYTRPWTVRFAFELLPDTSLLEFVCENNKWVPPDTR